MTPEHLAGGADASWINVVLNAGTAGVMLWWFMIKMTPAMTEVARAIDRIARTIVTLTLTVAQQLDHCEAVKAQCEGYKKELDEAEASRDKK